MFHRGGSSAGSGGTDNIISGRKTNNHSLILLRRLPVTVRAHHSFVEMASNRSASPKGSEGNVAPLVERGH